MSGKAKEATVTVRQLRSDWAQIKGRVAHGEYLILTHNGKPIMRLAPLKKSELSAIDLANLWEQRLARAKEIMGGRSTGASTVLAERADARR